MALTSVEIEIIRTAKDIVERQTLQEFTTFVQELMEAGLSPEPSWHYILQRVYLHACLKQKREIVNFLERLVATESRLQSLGWKSTVAYGKTLLTKPSQNSAA